MVITVGTFNLNNLFSRFNFQGAIDALADSNQPVDGITVNYEFSDTTTYRVRTFEGRLVKAKDEVGTKRIAERINRVDVDVLAVQEVENRDILRQFNSDYLHGKYVYHALIEGNDPRFIDVGILSKYPMGAVTSFQTAVHPSNPVRPVFGRDLLEVEIWNSRRSKKLFTLYNNHLKSHFVPFDEDPILGAQAANERRRQQAEMLAQIVEARMRPNSSYIILGDMNDPPDSLSLAPFVQAPGLGLSNGLTNPNETRPPKQETVGPGPQSTAWTYRHKESGQSPEFNLYDQIWLSPALAAKQVSSFIDRRKRHGGDGSDHDLAWIALDM